MASAAEARRRGDIGAAVGILTDVLSADPLYAPAWNLLGIVELERRDPTAAADCFGRALEADPDPPFAWANLATALSAQGKHIDALQKIEQALVRDAYFLPALLAKGETLRNLGREHDAAVHLRSVLSGLSPGQDFGQPVTEQIAQARAWLKLRAEDADRRHESVLAKIERSFPGNDLSRARVFAAERAGSRKVYFPNPTAGSFPFLPAFEFFDRSLFPWFAELEAQTNAIRDELLSLWAEDHPEFRAYVDFAPGMPENQWADLNHSTRWSAWFLWENGERHKEHCAQCPATAAAVERVPLLDTPGKGPTVMFSILQPRTRIPPHTGSTNARTTVHLPLIVPPDCGFRVGGETRAWRKGEAWAFDDTIEHEAWNESDQPRAILILDTWNPLLNEAEREVVRAVG